MELEIKQYCRKPFHVEGVQVTVENIMLVAGWCGGEVKQSDNVEPGAPDVYVQVKVKRAVNVRQTQAFVGDWVLKAGKGFKVYMDGPFKRSFELSGTRVTLEDLGMDPLPTL